MSCPACAALKREHTEQCETEVRAILERQLFVELGSKAGDLVQKLARLDDVILTSRKRQLKIAATKSEHQTLDHAT
jgi:hypothetical protein